MAEINIRPILFDDGGVTASNQVTQTADLTPAATKRALIDTIEVQFSVAHASNTCDIQYGPAGASHVNIIPQFGNFKYTRIHLASWFPRAVEIEGLDDLRIIMTKGGGTNTTSLVRIYYIERDE